MASEKTDNQPYESIALVDLNAIFAQHWFGNREVYESALEGTLNEVESIDRSVAHSVICLDTPPYFRKDMFAGYKANRPPSKPLMLACKRALKGKLEDRGYRLARAEGYEADDIIATLATVYRLLCDDVRIVGSDKDLLQLVNGKVKLFTPAIGGNLETLIDGPGCFAKTGVAPAQICDWLALMGDASDGVPGCPKVGAKTAAKLIATYGSLGGVYAAVEGHPVETKEAIGRVVFFNLGEHKAQVMRARELVQLRNNAPIDANDLLAKGERKVVEAVYTAPVPSDDGEGFAEALDSFEPTDDHVARAFLAREAREAVQFPLDPVKEAASQARIAEFNASEKARAAALYPKPEGKSESELLDPAVAISAPKSEPPPSTAQVKATVAAAHAVAPRAHAAELVGNDVGPAAKEAAEVKAVVRESASSTALAPVTRGPTWDLALEPRGMNQAKWIAETLAPMFPKLDGWQGCLGIILLGRELGLGVMASLMNFDIVEGRPSPKWQLIVAFATQHPDCEFFRMVESTSESATFETKRRQNTKVDSISYSVAQARQAGLWKPKGGWDKFPDAMCRKMAAVHLARAVYPDSKASGLYCADEMAA